MQVVAFSDQKGQVVPHLVQKLKGIDVSVGQT